MDVWRSVFLIILCVLPTAVNSAITPALFEVTKQGQTSYFFGSVHMGESRYYPLAQAVESRFAASKQLVLEVDMQDESAVQMEMMQLMMQHGMYLDGSDLKQNLPAPLYKQTIKTAKRLGVSTESISALRPWAVALLIGQYYYQSVGLDPNWGADKYFGDKAKQLQIPVYGLESLSDQIGAMLQLDNKGNTMLQQMLDEIDSSNDYTRRMIRAWEQGNSRQLAAIFNEELSGSTDDQLFVEHLLRRRNQGWLTQLKPMMEQQSLFVVVGAAHLVGPDNLLGALRSDGYTVTQLSY